VKYFLKCHSDSCHPGGSITTEGYQGGDAINAYHFLFLIPSRRRIARFIATTFTDFSSRLTTLTMVTGAGVKCTGNFFLSSITNIFVFFGLSGISFILLSFVNQNISTYLKAEPAFFPAYYSRLLSFAAYNISV
jgi:hypothetical protein